MEFEIIDLIKAVCVIGAAVLLGSLFKDEAKKTRQQGKKLYQAYFSIPGLLILLALLIPIILWILKA